ncbi:DUF3617 family protein [Pulveribacter sp.]|uniref:DUF3617 domain-containing protein n=1 Tax=Pulveribacter sp. TaxID=2678893 RepID=UPI0028A7DEF6|nr:DUF3617 family protein [Pulveribacter sp.]
MKARWHYGPWALALCLAWPGAQPLAREIPAAPRHPAQKSFPLPARKSGLWEVTVRPADLMLRRSGQAPRRPQTVQMCTSADAEAVMLLAVVPAQEDCHKTQVTPLRSGKAVAGYDIATVCYVHDNRVEAQVELRGDLQSAYSGAFSVQYSQTPLHNTGRMLFEGRWLGACQPGQRPGDMVLPNGVTVNVVDDRQRAQTHQHESDGHAH